VSIFRKGGQYYIERVVGHEGKPKVERLNVLPSAVGLDLKREDSPEYGDHYLIDLHGELVIKDVDGIVSVPRKLK
jgi:hypothetical protein